MKKLCFVLGLLFCLAPSSQAAMGRIYNGKFIKNASIGRITSGNYTRATPMWHGGMGWFALISYSTVYEYAFVIGCGQSNLVGNPPVYEPEKFPVITNEGFEIKTNGTYVNPYTEPSGNDDPPFDKSGAAADEIGSMFGAIIKNYYDATGTKVIVLALGANATSSIYWRDTAMQLASNRLSTALSRLEADGYDFGHRIHFVWQQGESGDSNPENYKNDLNTIFDYFIAQHPAYSFVFHMCYPSFANGTETGMELVADMRDDAFVASSYMGVYDYIHFDMDELNTIGGLVAQSMEAHP